MRSYYPDDLPIFMTPHGHQVCRPSIITEPPDFVFADSEIHPYVWTHYETCPLTPSAVLVYEACGGTIQTALTSLEGKRGRRPNLLRLWAKAQTMAATQQKEYRHGVSEEESR